MRQLAKLFLNSLWGKFGMRQDLHQNKLCTTIEELKDLFDDPTIEVLNVSSISDQCVLATFKVRNSEFAELNNFCNIFIAAATTAYARIELFNYLIAVQDRAAYTDTDCVFYESKEGHDLPTGDLLGQLKNELQEGEFITAFVAGGPKTYAYITNMNHVVIKAKGFKHDFTSKNAFTFDNLRELVMAFAEVSREDEGVTRVVLQDPKDRIQYNALRRAEINANFHQIDPTVPSATAHPDCLSVYYPQNITRKSCFKIFNQPLQKLYSVYYDKRVVLSNYDTIPYGYIKGDI
jgi:hypothetical protein